MKNASMIILHHLSAEDMRGNERNKIGRLCYKNEGPLLKIVQNYNTTNRFVKYANQTRDTRLSAH